MVSNDEAKGPETVEVPFTASAAEGLLIGVPIGIVMLVAAGALRLNITSFERFLFVCIAVGVVSASYCHDEDCSKNSALVSARS